MIGAPALWVTLEYVRSNLFFLAWPWNLLGHSQYLYLPVIQIADIAGVYGISFLMVMVNQFLSQVPEFFIFRKETHRGCYRIWQSNQLDRPYTDVAAALVLALSYGWYKLVPSSGSDKHLRVALIQGNLITRKRYAVCRSGEASESL